jgi:hypothetical protein
MNTPIKLSLKRLPYQEMMMLSRELGEMLDVNEHKIADAMTHLEINSDAEKRDAMFLNMLFNRKKTITIQPHGDGFRVCIPSMAGAEVIGTDIRACMSMLFDHVVTYNALTSTG